MSNDINEHTAQNSPALRPCPFCGSVASMRHGESYGHWPLCARCGATLPLFHSEDDAANAWNRRAANAEANFGRLVEAVREMRAAQREYFRTRAPSALSAAKAAERVVDDMLNPKPVRDDDNRQMKFDFSAPITDAERDADIREKWRFDNAERRAL